jgi:hypothetical protein
MLVRQGQPGRRIAAKKKVKRTREEARADCDAKAQESPVIADSRSRLVLGGRDLRRKEPALVKTARRGEVRREIAWLAE